MPTNFYFQMRGFKKGLLVVLMMFALVSLQAQDKPGESNYQAEKELYQITQEAKKKQEKNKDDHTAVYEELIRKFQALAEKYPQWEQTPALHLRIAEMQRALGKTDQSIQELKKLAQSSTDDQTVYKSLTTIALTYDRMGQYEQAVAQNREIIKRFNDKAIIVAAAKLNIGELLEKQDDWPAALLEVENILADYPQTPQALQVPIFIANHYRKTGEKEKYEQALQKAVTSYQDAINRNPGTQLAVLAKQVLGEAYIQMGELAKAHEVLDELVELLPKSANMHYNLAQLYLKESKLDKAIEELEKCLALVPENQSPPPGSQITLIRLYLDPSIKQGDKAVAYMESEIAKKPEDVALYNILADVYKVLGKDKEALAQYEKAITVNQTSPLSYNNLGLYYVKAKSFDKALTAFKKAVELDPKYILAQMNLGMLYEQMHQDKEAAAVYQTIIKAEPNAIPAYNNLAWLYAKDLKKLDEALKLALQATELEPKDANIKDTLGWIYYLKGDYAKALENLLAAVAVIDNHPSIRYHLGVTYQKLGKLKEAKSELEKALALGVDFPEKAQTETALGQMK